MIYDIWSYENRRDFEEPKTDTAALTWVREYFNELSYYKRKHGLLVGENFPDPKEVSYFSFGITIPRLASLRKFLCAKLREKDYNEMCVAEKKYLWLTSYYAFTYKQLNVILWIHNVFHDFSPLSLSKYSRRKIRL